MITSQARAEESEELQIRLALAGILRRWPYVLVGMTLGVLVAALKTSLTQPTWMGTFEIVLDSKDAQGGLGSVLNSNPILANLAGPIGKKSQKTELLTEVKVLQSASVLRPVFDEVLARKAALGEDVAGYRFGTWVTNLTLELEKDTTILSISYRDTNKNLILPVLRSLSDTYKNYSTSERNESLKNAIKFAKEQAQIYRKRSDASFRALNSYGLTYGITSNTITGNGGGVDVSKLLSSSNSSGTALNLGGGSGSSIKPNGDDPLAQLARLNQYLISKQQTFTAKDPSVIALKKERDALQRYIESSGSGSIAYPGEEVLSKDQAQNILILHQELERNAKRDKSTLDSMESALLSLQLEQERSSTPWQVISTPTLLESPVAPRKNRNLAIGLSAGMILGCAGALIADRRSGRIFNKQLFIELLPTQLLLELPSDQVNTWNDGLRLLGLGNAQGASLAILPLGEIQRSQTNRIRDIIKQTSNTNIEICHSIVEATKFDKLLLLASPGSIEKSHLERVIKELSLQTTPMIGWIWLD